MQIETRTVKNDPELYEYAAYARSECTVQGTTEKMWLANLNIVNSVHSV